jgi:branched-chain amino acid transport system permease protein
VQATECTTTKRTTEESRVYVQDLLNGLVSAGIYILIALGLTLILSIVGIVQMAHGEIYMLGAYFVYFFATSLGLNYFVALVLSIIVVGLVGIALERVFLRRFRGDVEGALICTIAFILILQTAVKGIAGPSYKDIPSPAQGVVTVFGARISWEAILVLGVSAVLVLALLLFIKKTKMGQAMVSISEDMVGAKLMGVNVDRLSSIAMFIGCALAAAAGGLIGAIFSLEPFMGGIALTQGITVIILGGLGSVPGAIVGGLILGLIDGLVTPQVSPTLASIISLVIVMLILLFRPKGLLGHE